DNARPHTTALTRDKLGKMYWTPLEHHLCSPDLSSFAFHMFGPLKETLGGERFNDDVAVEQYVRNWLVGGPSSFF
ncbi:hypothetical protein EAI_11817, partial [Harpegnathos saltator]